MKPLHSSRQRGITLIEALVAMVILALGILGLAAVQARMLVDTRTTNSRAIAIRLIGELSERIQLNVQGADPPAGGKSAYADGGTADTPPIAFPAPDAAAIDTALALACPTSGCNKNDQAAYDVADWRKNKVAAMLPNGRASIWQISPRQLQVVVAWQANENTSPTLSNLPAPSTMLQVVSQLQITATAAGNLCGTNANFICHIDFIDLPPAM